MKHAEGRSRKTAAEKTEPAVSAVVSGNCADESADGHHTLDSDIYHAAALGKAGAQGCQKKRRRGDQHCIDQKTKIFNDYIHFYFPPFFRLKITLKM